MHWLLALVLMCAACGEDRVPPPAGGDGGSTVAAPRLDAGTGDCRDDYDLTVGYCAGLDAAVPERANCIIATVDLYEDCLGPVDACVARCAAEGGPDVGPCQEACRGTDAG